MREHKTAMTDVEIMDYFEAAIDKKKAVDALAVKCRTTRADMLERLEDLGLIARPEKKENKNPRKIDEEKARELHAAGKTDAEIAEVFGVTVGAVCQWRTKRGLAPNRKEKLKLEGPDMQKKFEEILESVDAGRRTPEPCEQPEHGEHDFDRDTNVSDKVTTEDLAYHPDENRIKEYQESFKEMFEPLNMPEPVIARPAAHIRMERAEDEREVMSLGEFVRVLMERTNEKTLRGALTLDGRRVHDLRSLKITGTGSGLCVEVETC